MVLNVFEFSTLKMTERNTTFLESIFNLDDPPIIEYQRKKEDYICVAPTTGSAQRLNDNGAIMFELNNQESYLFLPESFLYCEIEIQKANGTALDNENITLEHNPFPRMFNQMVIEVGSQQLEIIDHPGEMDTMLKFITMSKTYKDTYGELQGWIADTGDASIVTDVDAAGTLARINKLDLNTGYIRRKQIYNNNVKKFTMKWYLSPLFGFLDHRKITYQLKIKLKLNRQINNEELFYGAAGTNAKIKINKLEWWVPQIFPSLDIETIITKRLNENQPIPVTFLKRSSVNVDIPAGTTTYDWQIANISSNPRYVIVAFKGNTPGDVASFTTNNHKYIGFNGDSSITALRLDLNQTHYPLENVKLDPINFNMLEAYNNYENLCKIFGNEPQLNILDYRNIYNIFCFDTSAQNEDLKKNGIQIKLHIEKSADLALKSYCLLLEDAKHSITVLNGNMVRIE
jgi:hypothetical protein